MSRVSSVTYFVERCRIFCMMYQMTNLRTNQLRIYYLFSETVSECPGPLDLIVVVDGSDSIFNDDFSAIKTAILGLLDTLILGEDNVKFGLVLYSSNITTVLALSSNKEHIRTRISTLTHSRQGTNTHLGIRKMNSMFAHHGRKGIPKAGIVITDGISKLPKKTAAAAAIAKRKNTNMYAVGITKHIDMNELENIASSDERVISLKNFSQLKIGITSLMKQVCPVITTTTTTTTTTAATTTTTAATTTAAAATTSAAAAETTATAATDSSTAATMPEKSTAETQTLPSDCVTSGNKVTLPNEDIEREEKERGGDDDNAGDDDDSKVSRLPKHRGGSSDEDEYPNSNTSQNNMTPGLLNLLFGRRRANKTGYRQYRREDDDDYRQYRRDYGGYGHYRRAYFDDDYRHNRQGYGGSSNMYHRYDDK